jgi:hypothetical protein
VSKAKRRSSESKLDACQKRVGNHEHPPEKFIQGRSSHCRNSGRELPLLGAGAQGIGGQKLDNAKIGEVEALADALIEFGIADLSVVGRQAQYRNRVLDDFQRLIDNPKTVEADVHRVLEANLWLLDIHGKIISSNESLKKVIETYLDGEVETPAGRQASLRTIWILDSGSDTPRLVTAYPHLK